MKKPLPTTPTPTQQAILQLLLGGPKSLEDLEAGIPTAAPSNISTQVSWARKTGWIDSSRNASDARCSVYEVTDAGKAALKTAPHRAFSKANAPRPHHLATVKVRLDGSMKMDELDAAFADAHAESRSLLIAAAVQRAGGDPERLAADLDITERRARSYLPQVEPAGGAA